MVEFILVVLAAAAAGFTAWAVDRNRSSYGVLLLPAAAVATAVLLRTVLLLVGLDRSGLAFLAWLLPIIGAIAVAAACAWSVGRRRAAADRERLSTILRWH
ncbi:hypothetical protein LVY72_12885 [Arthrobacter sp. I2-34]|uniref:Uncharacterized protein n=1 Tax=Arthrobacter hankyongi TaxID=2904801 RepID=A0ABS9L7Z1_9MICC|nr:hypothetical protein [Arthrobacter hankyongi]MCG2622796.1 hypothetical protein [Arthrobacter hankyongi]